MARLKVYKVMIGFHDAYVAAASRKAALAAWGIDHDAFARGDAEVVTDPALGEEPLATPGTVIKRLRGTTAEQIAALGEPRGPKPARSVPAPKPSPVRAPPAPRPKPQPRPSRSALDDAEAAVAAAKADHGLAVKAVAAREAALARERKAIEDRGAREQARLEGRRDKASAAYEQAMRRWRG